MTRIVLGVDPGLGGALAFVSDGKLLDIVDMPVVDHKVNPTLLTQFLRMHPVTDAAIELVSAAPVQGRRQGGQSMFVFGKATGTVLGAIGALEIPYVEPTPATWKKRWHLGSDKEKARAQALRLWPERGELFKNKGDHNRAEAALLARWHEERLTPGYDHEGGTERVHPLRLRLRGR